MFGHFWGTNSLDWFLGFMNQKCATKNSWRDKVGIGCVGIHHPSGSILSMKLKISFLIGK